jgi:hypothetical protein
VTKVTAVRHHPDQAGPPFVDYSASGTITNNGTGPMVPGVVFVTFTQGNGVPYSAEVWWPTDAAGHDLTPIIPPGVTVPWDMTWNGPGIDSVMLIGPTTPTVTAELSGWFWASPFSECLALGGT